MRDTLMVEALCWDTDGTVMARDVHGMDDLSLYCPHPECLAGVIAKFGGKNFYFAAPDKHVHGCPNEPPEVKNKDTTTEPTRKESVVPDTPEPIPTELGPGTRPKKKPKKPTREELLALASALVKKSPQCAGTLEAVVSAWGRMTNATRAATLLKIKGVEHRYSAGFFFLATAGVAGVADIHFGSQVIHGAATITYDTAKKCYWVKSAKTFRTGTGKSSALKLRVPEQCPAGGYIKSLLPTDSREEYACTLFYSGPPPRDTGASFMLDHDISNEYWRFVLRLPTTTDA